MRLHLDTSFLIDWWRSEPRAEDLVQGIIAGRHDVSVDPVVEAEFFAAQVIDARRHAFFGGVLLIAAYVQLNSATARLAASWLAPMDEAKRRAHFADALIAAVATVERATLVTGDQRISRVLPVTVLGY